MGGEDSRQKAPRYLFPPVVIVLYRLVHTSRSQIEPLYNTHIYNNQMIESHHEPNTITMQHVRYQLRSRTKELKFYAPQ